MLNRLARRAAPRDEMKRAYSLHWERLHQWLRQQQNIKVLSVRYNKLIEQPAKQAERVRDFLGMPANVEKMVQAVDTSLYCSRKATEKGGL